ncbi:MAG: DNA cytosine methyltransferase [Armatimonadetes bacterium]|nr:DNA cytosine methyltransferase [Armatimonadota bacterium]
MSIPIIDLFAGPGGLGEGFSALRQPGSTEKLFKIGLSVEMDRFAHQTLELRSFFRYFPDNGIPQEYYDYLAGNNMTREALFAAYPEAAEHAKNEALQAKLGTDTNRILARIRRALANNPRHWILIGGPPCQAYSTAGRARLKAEHAKKKTNFEEDPRHLLYQEYLKIIARFGPPIFVMENVRGIELPPFLVPSPSSVFTAFPSRFLLFGVGFRRG